MDHLRNADTPLAVVQPRLEVFSWCWEPFLGSSDVSLSYKCDLALPCSAHAANQACVERNLTSEWRLVGFLFLVCFPAVVGIQVFRVQANTHRKHLNSYSPLRT